MNKVTPPHLAERLAEKLRGTALPGTNGLMAQAEAGNAGPFSPLRPDNESLRAMPSVAPAAMPAAVIAPVAGVDRAKSGLISIEALEGAGMVGFQLRGDRIGEEFRMARHHIVQTITSIDAGRGRRNMIMVTSARPGEGKSFAALNLAAALAEGGKQSVLLVDGDIRERSLTRLLGRTADPGLLDLAMSPNQLIRTVAISSSFENLSFMPMGGGSDEAARAGSGNPIAAMLGPIADFYDNSLIVVDAPPCLANSDPTAFAAIVGQIVLVVEAGRTRRREVESALDILDSCSHISLLLNKVTSKGGGAFGAYS